MDFYLSVAGVDGCYPHDAIAYAAAVHPELFDFEDVHLKITLDGPERGKTNIVDEGFSACIARDIDVNRFRAQFFSDLDCLFSNLRD